MDKYAKALVAGVIAALGAYQTALISPGVSAGEWAGVIVAGVSAAAVVWGVPNASKDIPVTLTVENVEPATTGSIWPAGETRGQGTQIDRG